MLKSEKKKIVFKRLDAELKPLGWKRVCDSGHNPIYVFDNSFYKVKFDIQFVKEPIEFFPIELAIKEVEPYITECIGDTEWIPGRGILIDNKTMFRTTIEDKTNLEKYNDYVVKTEDDINMVVDYFLDYLFDAAKKFVETYLYLPNIVRKIDEFIPEDIDWNYNDDTVLSGRYDGYFRGLIISKLCNDTKFEEKFKYVDDMFQEYGANFWSGNFSSDYEKLKQLLPTIEPKYSMDSPNEEAEMEKIRAMVAKNFTPLSAPTEKAKKNTERTFVPTPPELVNKELLILLGGAQGEKESLLSSIKSIFGNKAKEEVTPQKQTLEIVGCYLDACLRNHGFCNVHRDKNVFYYTRPTDVGNLIFSFMVGNNGCLRIYPPSIRLDKVEEWMQKIDIKLKSRDGDHQGTIELELPKKIVKLNDSECVGNEEVEKLCLATWQFIEEKFGDFVEDYSSPQFLWERLCSDIKAYPDWVKIIRGITAPEQIIRGVVFLRLCRDNDFEDKFELVKKFILTEYKHFIPSVNQLKRLLPEMKKEYEVCS
jgi:hypothetical protein